MLIERPFRPPSFPRSCLPYLGVQIAMPKLIARQLRLACSGSGTLSANVGQTGPKLGLDRPVKHRPSTVQLRRCRKQLSMGLGVLEASSVEHVPGNA